MTHLKVQPTFSTPVVILCKPTTKLKH